MMHDMRSIHRVDRWHPVVQAEREILVEQICALVWTADELGGEGGRAWWCG